MNVCFVTSECVPYSKTGGLADVSGSLPKALNNLGCSVKIFTPLYQSIDTRHHELTFSQDLYQLHHNLGGRDVLFNVWYAKLPGSDVEVHFIDCPHYYHRPTIYTSDDDENQRFILLQHAAFKIMQRYNWSPDILHCNDWQSGLMPALATHVYNWDTLFAESQSVLTIHNIAYQGLFSPETVDETGLPGSTVGPGGPLEHHGALSFLKAGISYAQAVTTVSPTYAHEIQHPAFGSGMDDVLRTYRFKLSGILNGIDTEEWNPAYDKYISHNFSANTLEDKEKVKKDLLQKFGLKYKAGTPLFGVVSRLTSQKGLELLEPILAHVLENTGMQLIVLGSGDEHLEHFFQFTKGLYPDRMAVFIGYNNELAHWIEAGADFFIMPSRFEPCGLNQMYSLAYGTLPIVRRTGGLADSVIDVYQDPENGTGISFDDFTPEALLSSLYRAIQIFEDPKKLSEIRHRGMNSDFSWKTSARKYLSLYQGLKSP